MDETDPEATERKGPEKVGTRLRCAECGSELIVVTAGESLLSCCGRALVPVQPPSR
jgi:hypothetical protein